MVERVSKEKEEFHNMLERSVYKRRTYKYQPEIDVKQNTIGYNMLQRN
jgi:hypothetical protein